MEPFVQLQMIEEGIWIKLSSVIAISTNFKIKNYEDNIRRIYLISGEYFDIRDTADNMTKLLGR